MMTKKQAEKVKSCGHCKQNMSPGRLGNRKLIGNYGESYLV